MVRKQQEFWVKLVFFTGISLIFAFFMLALSPRFSFLGRLISAKDLTLMVTQYRVLPNFGFFTRFGFAFAIFAIASIMVSMGTSFLSYRVREGIYKETETALFDSFINKLRFCYTRENLIEAIQQELEYKADCSVLFTNTDTDLVIYNSTSTYVSDPDIYAKLAHRFSVEWLEHWGEGLYLLDSDMQMTTDKKKKRGGWLLHTVPHDFLLSAAISVPLNLKYFYSFLRSLKTISDVKKHCRSFFIIRNSHRNGRWLPILNMHSCLKKYLRLINWK